MTSIKIDRNQKELPAYFVCIISSCCGTLYQGISISSKLPFWFGYCLAYFLLTFVPISKGRMISILTKSMVTLAHSTLPLEKNGWFCSDIRHTNKKNNSFCTSSPPCFDSPDLTKKKTKTKFKCFWEPHFGGRWKAANISSPGINGAQRKQWDVLWCEEQEESLAAMSFITMLSGCCLLTYLHSSEKSNFSITLNLKYCLLNRSLFLQSSKNEFTCPLFPLPFPKLSKQFTFAFAKPNNRGHFPKGGKFTSVSLNYDDYRIQNNTAPITSWESANLL